MLAEIKHALGEPRRRPGQLGSNIPASEESLSVGARDAPKEPGPGAACSSTHPAPAGTSRPRPPERQTAASLRRSRALRSDGLCGRCGFSWLAPLGRNSLITVVSTLAPSAGGACRHVAASGCWARGGPGAHSPRLGSVGAVGRPSDGRAGGPPAVGTGPFR